MDNPFKSPAILSLCTGMRGLERGIERAIGDISVKCYVEIESFIVENLVRQMEKGVLAPTPVWSNLKTFPFASFHRKVHGIIGGYPCQPFSVAGNRKGTDDPRHLWPFIKDGIRAARPVWCFFENVPGHLTLGYEQVRSDLSELGYAVEEGIYSAEEVGAPHQRKRLFILAIQSGVGQANSKSKLHEQPWDSRKRGAGSSDSCINELAQPDSIGPIHSEPEINPAEGGVNALRDIATGCGNVADSSQPGLQGYSGDEQKKGWQGTGQNRPTSQSSISPWPSRPGIPQHNWEPPRVESRLGFMLNGYNFREDLLRMAGNGVVPQTAELAFLDLMKKHFND